MPQRGAMGVIRRLKSVLNTLPSRGEGVTTVLQTPEPGWSHTGNP